MASRNRGTRPLGAKALHPMFPVGVGDPCPISLSVLSDVVMPHIYILALHPAPVFVPMRARKRLLASPSVAISPVISIVGAGTDFQVLASGSGSNVPGLIAGGSVLLAAGADTMVYSAIKLTKNIRRRALVCDSVNAEGKLP